MLVLSRNLNEQIRIDGPAIVQVVKINNGNVKLGFIAPSSTRIVRTELENDHEPEECDVVQYPEVNGNVIHPTKKARRSAHSPVAKGRTYSTKGKR